ADETARAILHPVRELCGEHAGEVASRHVEDAERRAFLLQHLARVVEPGAAQPARPPVDGDQGRQHQSVMRRMKPSQAVICEARMNSLGWCAWAMSPGPHTTVGTPSVWRKMPASVP